MNKVILTIESTDPRFVAAAMALLHGGQPTEVIVKVPEAPVVPQAAVSDAAPVAPPPAAVEPEQAQPEKRQRKPRSDAGKPRGSYKPTGEPAASEPQSPSATDSAVAGSAAPATPTTSTPPQAAPAASSAVAAPAAGAGAVVEALAKKLTKDDAFAALSRINAEPGLGMEACRKFMLSLGYNRISDVKEETYADFITKVDAAIAAHRAAKA